MVTRAQKIQKRLKDQGITRESLQGIGGEEAKKRLTGVGFTEQEIRNVGGNILDTRQQTEAQEPAIDLQQPIAEPIVDDQAVDKDAEEPTLDPTIEPTAVDKDAGQLAQPQANTQDQMTAVTTSAGAKIKGISEGGTQKVTEETVDQAIKQSMAEAGIQFDPSNPDAIAMYNRISQGFSNVTNGDFSKLNKKFTDNQGLLTMTPRDLADMAVGGKLTGEQELFLRENSPETYGQYQVEKQKQQALADITGATEVQENIFEQYQKDVAEYFTGSKQIDLSDDYTRIFESDALIGQRDKVIGIQKQINDIDTGLENLTSYVDSKYQDSSFAVRNARESQMEEAYLKEKSVLLREKELEYSIYKDMFSQAQTEYELIEGKAKEEREFAITQIAEKYGFTSEQASAIAQQAQAQYNTIVEQENIQAERQHSFEEKLFFANLGQTHDLEKTLTEQTFAMQNKEYDQAMKRENMLFQNQLDLRYGKNNKTVMDDLGRMITHRPDGTIVGIYDPYQQMATDIGANSTFWGNLGSGTTITNSGELAYSNDLDIDAYDGQPIEMPFNATVLDVYADPNDPQNEYGDGPNVKMVVRSEDGHTITYNHLNPQMLDYADGLRGTTIPAGEVGFLAGKTGYVIPGKGGDGSHIDIMGRDPQGNVMTGQQLKDYHSKATLGYDPLHASDYQRILEGDDFSTKDARMLGYNNKQDAQQAARKRSTTRANQVLNPKGFEVVDIDSWNTLNTAQRLEVGKDIGEITNVSKIFQDTINIVKENPNWKALPMFSKSRRQIEQNLTDIRLMLKGEKQYNLGVLTGPDLDLLKQVLPSFDNEFIIRYGTDEFINVLKQAENKYKEGFETSLNMAGVSFMLEAQGGTNYKQDVARDGMKIDISPFDYYNTLTGEGNVSTIVTQPVLDDSLLADFVR